MISESECLRCCLEASGGQSENVQKVQWRGGVEKMSQLRSKQAQKTDIDCTRMLCIIVEWRWRWFGVAESW